MASPVFYKYGILTKRTDDLVWRIITIGPTTADNISYLVEDEVFVYKDEAPKLGDRVKVGFGENDEITIVKECRDWLRDVQIFAETIVIHGFFRIPDELIVFTDEEKNQEYYLLNDPESDMPNVAILKSVLDEELLKRKYQKVNEPVVYRIGVHWNPIAVKDKRKIRWKHFPQTSLVPIYELYRRESTFPFISPSMVYGCLDGLVIATNDTGALVWSSQLGCAIVSSSTARILPSMGSTMTFLATRSLPEKCFNFGCEYEVLPVFYGSKWNGSRILYDSECSKVYVESEVNCAKLHETNELMIYNKNLGYVCIENDENEVKEGCSLYARLSFEQPEEGQPYVPVVKDLLLNTEFEVDCRIVYICENERKCFALIDSSCLMDHSELKNVGFIEVPERVLWCSKARKRVADNLLLLFVTLRIRIRRDWSTVCVDLINTDDRNLGDDTMRICNGSAWLRTKAKIVNFHLQGPLLLAAYKTRYMILDPLRMSQCFGKLRDFSINAECVLHPQIGIPIFLVRHVSSIIRTLPVLTIKMAEELPTADTVFKSLPNNATCEQELEKEANFVKEMHEALYEVEGLGCDTTLDETVQNRTFDTQVVCESMVNDSVADETDLPTILDESEYEHRHPMRDLSTPFKSNRWTPSPTFSPNNLVKRNTFLRWKDTTCNTKYGTRQYRAFRGRRIDFNDFLDQVVYENLNDRFMFTERPERIIRAWTEKMRFTMQYKARTVQAIGVEISDFNRSFCNPRKLYDYLVRFYVTSPETKNCDRFVVIPIGGQFPSLPIGFELGRICAMILITNPRDPIVRVGGYGAGTGEKEIALNHYKTTLLHDNYIVRGPRGNSWLRIKTQCIRPGTRRNHQEDFELWDSPNFEGLAIVELGKLDLEDIDPSVYESYTIECTIEPLPGGPFNITNVVSMSDSFLHSSDFLIFWKVVTRKDDANVPDPVIVKKTEHPKPEVKDVLPQTPFDNSMKGYTAIMKHVEFFHRERFLRLQRNNDHRIAELLGTSDTGELNKRCDEFKVKNKKVLDAFTKISENLETLQKNGIWNECTREEVDKFINYYEEDIPFKFGMFDRSISFIRVGCNFLIKLLVDEDVVRQIHKESGEEIKNMFVTVADCLCYNFSFLENKDKPEVRFFLNYCERHGLNDCD